LPLMAGWTRKQILIGITVALAMIDCAGWAVSTLLIWWFRTAGFFEPLTPEQLSVNTQFAVVVSALLVLNIAGALAFILTRGGYGLPVLALVQAVDIVATVILVNMRASTPPPASTMAELVAVPTAALVLLAVLWRGVRPPTSSC